jgi:hypothetical protein
MIEAPSPCLSLVGDNRFTWCCSVGTKQTKDKGITKCKRTEPTNETLKRNGGTLRARATDHFPGAPARRSWGDSYLTTLASGIDPTRSKTGRPNKRSMFSVLLFLWFLRDSFPSGFQPLQIQKKNQILNSFSLTKFSSLHKFEFEQF